MNALVESVKEIASGNWRMNGVLKVGHLTITPEHGTARDTVRIRGAVRAPSVHAKINYKLRQIKTENDERVN